MNVEDSLLVLAEKAERSDDWVGGFFHGYSPSEDEFKDACDPAVIAKLCRVVHAARQASIQSFYVGCDKCQPYEGCHSTMCESVEEALAELKLASDPESQSSGQESR
jgi:hypothetical protein